MKIVSFNQPLVLTTAKEKEASIYEAANPGERMVLNDDMAMQLSTSDKIESISDFLPFYQLTNQKPANFRGKRVLFYRNRGVGDQLGASCLARFFTEKLKAVCFQLSDRHHNALWIGNPCISGMPVKFPLSIDSLVRFKGRPFYDWFFPLESVSEWNTEPEQGNFYDHMFALCGIDPERVESFYKKPVWGMLPGDLDAFKIWKESFNVSDSYIAVQLAATNLVRTPPLSVIEKILARLNDIGLPVLCLDDKPFLPEVANILSMYPNVKDMSCTLPSVRLYGAVIANSKFVVGCDSSAIHFAGAFDKPCIGVWGPFSPESRSKYYKNHYPIYHPEMCLNAPCFNFLPGFPIHKCPNGAEQKTCEVFLGITTQEIDKVVTEVVQNHKII